MEYGQPGQVRESRGTALSLDTTITLHYIQYTSYRAVHIQYTVIGQYIYSIPVIGQYIYSIYTVIGQYIYSI